MLLSMIFRTVHIIPSSGVIFMISLFIVKMLIQIYANNTRTLINYDRFGILTLVFSLQVEKYFVVNVILYGMEYAVGRSGCSW